MKGQGQGKSKVIYQGQVKIEGHLARASRVGRDYFEKSNAEDDGDDVELMLNGMKNSFRKECLEGPPTLAFSRSVLEAPHASSRPVWKHSV